MTKQEEARKDLLALPHLDWRAYLVAAVVAGLTSLLAGSLLSQLVLGDAAFILRMTASLVMGAEVIPVTEGSTATVLLVGALVHFILTFAYALVIVLIVHRWGLVVGLVGGALLGLALYVIGIYAISYFFPWIYPVRSWMLAVVHMILGGLVGAVYELLDEYDLPFPATSMRQEA